MRPPAVVTTGGTSRFALRLDYLHPDEKVTLETVLRDGAALLTSLEGQHDAVFTLQTVARPAPRSPERARLEVHLVVSLVRGGGRTVLKRRIAELADDLLDLFSAPPVRWSFTPVTDDDDLDGVLDPIPATHFAEIARREEPPSPPWVRPSKTAGFTVKPGERSVGRGPWSLWTFGPPAADPERLATVLLAQEDPVCIRVSVTPTALADEERAELERLIATQQGVSEASPVLAASLRTIEAFLYLRPLFEVQCVVGSTTRLSRSLLSAIGHSMSEPAVHGPSGAPTLHGGFAVVRGAEDPEHAALAAAYGAFRPAPAGPSLAPPALRRIRYLFGPWEAAHVFRIPISADDRFPGLAVLDVPDLPGPLHELPRDGRLLGTLPGPPERDLRIDPEERFRHTYVVGQTGTGKSTLLLNLAMQDIAAGAGVAVLDPHGDLIEALLARIPDDRIDDVVLVDPADPVAVVGVNALEAETAIQQSYVVSELCNLFYQLFDPHRLGIVGPRFESMMRQAALLLLAHPEQPSSFLDISTPFTDPAVRMHLVSGLRDPILAEFWKGEFQQTGDFHRSEVLAWFRSKFEVFRTSPLVRRVVGQARSTVSFTDILRDQKILLVNLSKGLLGNYNSGLLGSLVFARLWSAILERAAAPAAERPDFFVYIDEFQNMTSESLPEVLSEARKFRVGLTIANQFFSQIPQMTRDAVMGNVASRITFRLGPKDAGPFAAWLGSAVDPEDLVTLPNFTALSVISDRGVPLDPCMMVTHPADRDRGRRWSDQVRARARAQWARPVDEIDEEFAERWAEIPGSIASAVHGLRKAHDGAAAVDVTRGTAADDPPTRQSIQMSWVEEWLAKRIARHCGNRIARAAILLLPGFAPASAPEEVAALLGDPSPRQWALIQRGRSPSVAEGSLATLRRLGMVADRLRIQIVVEGDPRFDDALTTRLAQMRADTEARRARRILPIEFLGLAPAHTILAKHDIATVGMLERYRRAELVDLGMTRRHLDTVVAELRRLGTDLRADTPQPVTDTAWLKSLGLDRILTPDLDALRQAVAKRMVDEVYSQLGIDEPPDLDDFLDEPVDLTDVLDGYASAPDHTFEARRRRAFDIADDIADAIVDAVPTIVEHLDRVWLSATSP